MGKPIKSEVERLIEAGKRAGRKAMEENFALGLPVHIVENGNLVAVDKNGNKTIIRKLDIEVK